MPETSKNHTREAIMVRPDCENINCNKESEFVVKVMVGDRKVWPNRWLCRKCASATVASGRVGSLYHLTVSDGRRKSRKAVEMERAMA